MERLLTLHQRKFALLHRSIHVLRLSYCNPRIKYQGSIGSTPGLSLLPCLHQRRSHRQQHQGHVPALLWRAPVLQ